MSQNNNIQDPEIKVEEALSRTEKFFETYKKPMLYTALAIIIIAAGVFAYHNFVTLPKQQEAMSQTFSAEQYFRADDFDKALNGDGNTLGFKQIIQNYGSNAGEAVYFYAGVCELHLANYSEALKYLKEYSGKDAIISARAIACIGDAYAGLKDLKAATEHYEKAANSADNIFAAGYLLKAGIMYEELGQPQEALKMYEIIKNKYPQSPEGYEINKYISRIQVTIK
ncbi:MAG: tetratricopeptide repeat protein [Bacteroidales bacterium]